jgi:hypothetical protein
MKQIIYTNEKPIFFFLNNVLKRSIIKTLMNMSLPTLETKEKRDGHRRGANLGARGIS